MPERFSIKVILLRRCAEFSPSTRQQMEFPDGISLLRISLHQENLGRMLSRNGL
jgi:hypothetical protein